jgi:hypothetical protein
MKQRHSGAHPEPLGCSGHFPYHSPIIQLD